MKKFYPVVHIINSQQTLANVQLAKDVGADGVFLIDHHGRPSEFFLQQVVSSFQDDSFSVGINYLMGASANAWALSTAKAIGFKMCWSDNAGTDVDNELAQASNILNLLGEGDHNLYKACGNQVLELQQESGVEFFGGIHFKYQQKPKCSLSESLKRAFPYIRYPTLSGAGTGIAADLEHIKEAALAWQEEQGRDSDPYTAGLAIASGISTDNVNDYLPYIDIFLVASSIMDETRPDEYFDHKKIDILCNKIKSYKS